jgi:hypothetical protein
MGEPTLREEIARIIEPDLWRFADEGKRPYTAQRIANSLDKASAILALLDRRVPTGEGEERTSGDE